MSNYWGEIRRFFQKEKIKFVSERCHYDPFYGKYQYIVTITEPESITKFMHYQELGYFGAMKLCKFKIISPDNSNPIWF